SGSLIQRFLNVHGDSCHRCADVSTGTIGEELRRNGRVVIVAVRVVVALSSCTRILNYALPKTPCGPKGERTREASSAACLVQSGRTLARGESSGPIRIDAGLPWNCTGVRLESGATYDFAVEGKQDWIDGSQAANVQDGWVGVNLIVRAVAR